MYLLYVCIQNVCVYMFICICMHMYIFEHTTLSLSGSTKLDVGFRELPSLLLL